MRPILLLLALLLGACAQGPVATGPGPGGVPDRVTRETAIGNFRAVVERVEPVAERECRRRAARGTDCDFVIVVEPSRRLPPNAFQTLDRNGRPVVGFTRALIAEARNQDEIAFVLAHEAAHHIEGHIARGRQAALAAQALAEALAQLGGADERGIARAAEIGLVVGSRRFSKEFELEADRLGTVITARAGFDPLVGAEFFNRLPDPGDRFLGTHPPNADRLAAVRSVAAGL
jgi:predicted Zn-dependent protease